MSETTPKTTGALIEDLLARPDTAPETEEDLRRWQGELEAGTLHPEDADYIAAFHARLSGVAPDEATPVASGADETLVDALRAERDAALARAEIAEAEVARLTALLDGQDQAPT